MPTYGDDYSTGIPTPLLHFRGPPADLEDAYMLMELNYPASTYRQSLTAEDILNLLLVVLVILGTGAVAIYCAVLVTTTARS